MVEIELHRLEPRKYTGLLEKRSTPLTDINQYLVQEFGEDGNGGINNALNYVCQKYGGGKYDVRFCLNGVYVRNQIMELAGPPKVICQCDLTVLMNRGCQCKGV